MNDYYEKRKSDFIKTYEIKENVIELNLASEKKRTVKNTLENRMKIKQIMDDQIKKAYRHTKKKYIFFLFIFYLSILFCFFDFHLTKIITIIACKVLKDWSGANFLDAAKNIDFYENEMELNFKLVTEPNLLDCLTEEKKKMLINQPKEELIFNYNSVDKLTYEELRQILINLKMAKQLNSEYTASQKSEIQEGAYTRNLQYEKNVIFKNSDKN